MKLNDRICSRRFGAGNGIGAIWRRKNVLVCAWLILAVCALFVMPAFASAGEEAEKAVDYTQTFPSWDPDSASLEDLITFVSGCVDETSEEYLDPAERIAVFDMDGTILCEKAPVYIDYCLTMYRVLDDPSYDATEEEIVSMQQIRDHAYSVGETMHPEGLTKHDIISKAFAGMTPEEFRSYVVNFADSENVVGFEGMTYAESFYQPMLEVIHYLKENDFDVWMVSACEREVVRALVERYDIPYDHVVATDVPYAASGKGDEEADEYNMGQDEVIVLGEPLDDVECGKSGKSAAIAREIGRRPVLAFGNSSGDYSMLNYAAGNPYHEGKGFFVVCDDTQREYGSDDKAAEYYAKVQEEGWTAISMANDWMSIYGDGVAKTGLPGIEREDEETFTLWNEEAPALEALIDYVESVTDPASPDFIPEEDRIATFDMDGTLMGELFPTYLEVMLLTERILSDPSYQPDEEMLEFGCMTRDHAIDKSFPADYDYAFSYHQAKAFAGMTLTEYADFVTDFLAHEADGFEGMTYAEGYYKPMKEVIDYLQDNGFRCYIVSGSDRFIVRAFIQGVFDIPADQVIGSDTALEARDQGDTDGIEYVFSADDELVRTDRLIIKDLKTNKVLQIAQEIGKQPVLSFGNSSGDVSMNNYAVCRNPYRSAAFMLVADDGVRDYGSYEVHDELMNKWHEMGYNVISMADDWKTIYGEGVTKTGAFHWMEDYGDELELAA